METVHPRLPHHNDSPTMIACLDQHQRRRGTPLAGGEPNPSADTDPEFLPAASHPAASTDFGGILHSLPAAVVRPSTSADVARTIRFAAQTDHLTIAARGNGHSIHGQAMAHGGIVLDMRALTGRKELVGPGLLADVPAGALWEEVLDWAVLEHGLAPVSWTDYLGLTVGGTISNGGISGQAWKTGPQVSNVAELEVVTGDGERRVCSPSVLPDLFFSVLGGLGQFGVITRARIPLAPAPDMVKWIRVVYGRFEEYSGDAERLVGRPGPAGGFDYVEGFAFVNRDDPVNGWGSVPLKSGSEFDPAMVPPDSGPVLYCLEVAVHYNQRDAAAAVERAAEMLRPLRYVRGLEFAVETSYVSFLTRVKRAEEAARANGTWHAPHPWLNLLVSASDIADFDRHVFKRILKDGVGGPMLVYPLLRSKWDPRMSVALPEGEVFYLVALLRFGPLPAVEEMLRQNREIVARCEDGGYDYKLYLPHYESQADWARHFGRGWSRFVERKARYDPQAILSPGQGIFCRTPGGEAGAPPPPPTVLCEDVRTWTSD